jgi:integrase/recombinase XerC
MSSLPAPRPGSEISLLPRVTVADLYDALITDSRCENTRNARDHDCRVFAKFLGMPDNRTACAFLASQELGQANAVAMAFRQHEMARGCAPATINRRLAALRRLIVLGRRLGVVPWTLDVDDLRASAFRDSRGPALDEWRQLWEWLITSGDSPLARRDRALIRLIHDSALRKFEALAIDLDDLDLGGDCPRVCIPGKGSGGAKTWIGISSPSARFIREWLEVRGQDPGPLFVSDPHWDARWVAQFMGRVTELRGQGLTWGQVADTFNAERSRTAKGLKWNSDRLEQNVKAIVNRAPHVRLCEREVNRILHSISAECGFNRHVKPHGLRHAAITRALDLTGGDVRKVMRYARHAKPETTLRYDDNRADFGAELARIIGNDV